MKSHAIQKHTQEKAGTLRASKADAIFHQDGRVHQLSVCDGVFLVFEQGKFWRPLNQSSAVPSGRIMFWDADPARCAGLISSCPFGTKQIEQPQLFSKPKLNPLPNSALICFPFLSNSRWSFSISASCFENVSKCF